MEISVSFYDFTAPTQLSTLIRLWLLKCCKNKNSYDMKIYFHSIKVTLYLLNKIYFHYINFFFMISKYIFIQSNQISL